MKIPTQSIGFRIGAVLTLVSAGLGYDLYVKQQEVATTEKRLSEIHHTLKDAKTQQRKKADSGLHADVVRTQALNDFSGVVSLIAEETGVRLSQLQFDATTQALPGQPMSKETLSKPGWAMNPMTFVIEGPTPQVYMALKKIREIQTPFEFSDIAINRMVKSDTGEAGVTANVKLAVLIRTEGAS